MECKECEEKMIDVTEDEGGIEVKWCMKCGSLALSGETDEFYKIGDKPPWVEGE